VHGILLRPRRSKGLHQDDGDKDREGRKKHQILVPRERRQESVGAMEPPLTWSKLSPKPKLFWSATVDHGYWEGRTTGENWPIYATLDALLRTAVEAASREARAVASRSDGGGWRAGVAVAARRRQRKGEGNEGIRVWVLLGLHGFGSRVVFKKRNGSFCKSSSEEPARGARGGAAVRHAPLETRGEQQSQGAFKNFD
jgi:hypothetical protein